jgi:hypothetical protein
MIYLKSLSQPMFYVISEDKICRYQKMDGSICDYFRNGEAFKQLTEVEAKESYDFELKMYRFMPRPGEKPIWSVL